MREPTQEEKEQAFDRAVREGRINAEWEVRLMPPKEDESVHNDSSIHPNAD